MTRSMLVVDDVPEICSFFERWCAIYRAHPIEVTTTGDPVEALALVSQRPFDVVISDFRMPHVSGVQVLAAARSLNPSGRRVLMTGYNEIPATAEEMAAAGLSARLRKPMFAASMADFLRACFNSDLQALQAYDRLWDE